MSTLNFIPLKGLVLLPEAYLTITLVIILFYGIMHKFSVEGASEIKFLNRFFYIGIGLIIFALFLVAAVSPFSLESMHGFFKISPLIIIVKIIILSFTILIILAIKEYLLSDFTFGSEYVVILFFSILGLSALASANDLISVFLAVEFSSLPFYLLAINKKYKLEHNNAALKYFILSLVSSGIMLYGISFVYGYVGSTNFTYIASFLAQNSNSNLILVFAILLIVVGLGFKIALVPFHMWLVDVYNGLNYALTLFLNTVFKLGFFFILLKILWGPFYSVIGSWWYIIYILSIASIVVGYVGALYQRNLMSIISYSSISQMGFAAIFFLNKSDIAVIAFILFFILYIVANIGIFAILMWSDLNYKKLTTLDDLQGFASKSPFYAFMLAVFFLSLAGLPPLGGFFAKLFVIYTAVMGHYYALSVIAVIASLLGMFFYTRIVRYIYMKSNKIDEIKIRRTRFASLANLVVVVCFLFILLFIVCLVPLNNFLSDLSILYAL